MITEINKETARQIDREVVEALEPIAKRFGLVLKPKGGRYDPDGGTFSPRYDFVLRKTKDGQDIEQAVFSRFAPLFGLTPGHFGKSFTVRGNDYTLVGLLPNRPRYPILAKNAAGKRFKFTEDVLRLLK